MRIKQFINREKIKNLKNGIKQAYQKDYVKIVTVFLFFFIIFNVIQFSVINLPSTDDPLFHIRFAEIFREKGLESFRDFPWLHFSKIAENQKYFIYYNFLFYLIVIPFTFVKPLFLGIKLYGAIFGSLSFVVLYGLLLKWKEKNTFLWMLVLFSIIYHPLLWRLLMMRPFTLAPAILALLLYLAYKRKYWGIGIVSALYLYWHTATFFFPVFVVGLYSVFEVFYGKKFNWKIIVSSFLGIFFAVVASLIFAPGLFYFMKDVVFGIFYDTIIGKKVDIAEGLELYPPNVFNFVNSFTLVISLLVISSAFEIFRYIQEKKDGFFSFQEESDQKRSLRGTLFFLSLFFLLATFLSGRNGDFFVFFSALYLVIGINFILKNIRFENILIKKSAYVGLLIVVAYLFIANIFLVRNRIAASPPYDRFEAVGTWLKNNAQKGEVIFNTNWGWFTELFYYDSDNYYIAGIEPRFFYDYDPKLYWLWWHISNNGFICYEENCGEIFKLQAANLKNDERKKIWYNKQGNLIADAVKNNFQSRHIVISKGYTNLIDVMDNNPRFEKVFEEQVYKEFFIYKLK